MFPPCKVACPIHQDVQKYVSLIAQGKFEESLAVVRETNPLPVICGRICTHPCEYKCRRAQVEQPIAIMALKRFVAEHPEVRSRKSQVALAVKPNGRASQKSSARVAIIGSGPAGLSCAHDLALMGYKCTIFEALSVAGGMLRVGIPEYRLPKRILEHEIKSVADLGIEIKTNTPIGQKITISDLLNDYQAVFIAAGAHKNVNLNIEGEDLEGVIPGLDFLRKVNLGEEVSIGKKVAVIGGGNTAIDAARTALRLGAREVSILYRRTFDEMPANPEEIEEAKNEGVQIKLLTAPTKITARDNNKIDTIECVNMKLGEPDESGRRRPLPIKGSEYNISVDTVIPAVGQALDSSFIGGQDKINLNPFGSVTIDEVTMATSRKGVFAGGDATSGPKSAVEAIAAGKRAAFVIDMYLRGQDLSGFKSPKLTPIEDLSAQTVERLRTSKRQTMPTLPLNKRLENFDVVELGLGEEAAIKEALRCLNCGAGAEVIQEKCVSCLTCVRVCPFEAPFIGGQRLEVRGLKVGADVSVRPEVRSQEQDLKEGMVEIDIGECQACGICYTECPARAIKFKLYPEDEIIKQLEAALKVQSPKSKVQSPTIIGFYCRYGAYRKSSLKNSAHIACPANIKPIEVLCTAKIDLIYLLKAFELGAEGVFMAGCANEECNFQTGNQWAKKRVGYAKKILDEIGLGAGRLEIFELTEPFEDQFRKAAVEMTEKVQKL